jgi:hypothetical protein
MIEGKGTAARASRTRQRKTREQTLENEEDLESVDHTVRGAGKVIKVMLPKLNDKVDSNAQETSLSNLIPWGMDSKIVIPSQQDTPQI